MNQVDKELMQEKGILTENEKADEYEIQKAAMKEAVFFLAAMLEKNLDMSELQTISLYLKELSMKQHYMHIHLYVQQLYRNSRPHVLMGPVGTGKSFFAGCVANRLMEQGIQVMMTNFSRILNELTKPYADKNEFISHLVSYPLLIIDDLGIERKPYLFHHFFQLFYILRCGSTYGVCNFGKLVDVHTNLVHFLIHCFQISGICIDNHAINRHLTEIDTHIRGLG